MLPIVGRSPSPLLLRGGNLNTFFGHIRLFSQIKADCWDSSLKLSSPLLNSNSLSLSSHDLAFTLFLNSSDPLAFIVFISAIIFAAFRTWAKQLKFFQSITIPFPIRRRSIFFWIFIYCRWCFQLIFMICISAASAWGTRSLSKNHDGRGLCTNSRS